MQRVMRLRATLLIWHAEIKTLQRIASCCSRTKAPRHNQTIQRV